MNNGMRSKGADEGQQLTDDVILGGVLEEIEDALGYDI
jgi:hypothetical protein